MVALLKITISKFLSRKPNFSSPHSLPEELCRFSPFTFAVAILLKQAMEGREEQMKILHKTVKTRLLS